MTEEKQSFSEEVIAVVKRGLQIVKQDEGRFVVKNSDGKVVSKWDSREEAEAHAASLDAEASTNQEGK